jgi:hypothetical protein
VVLIGGWVLPYPSLPSRVLVRIMNTIPCFKFSRKTQKKIFGKSDENQGLTYHFNRIKTLVLTEKSYHNDYFLLGNRHSKNDVIGVFGLKTPKKYNPFLTSFLLFSIILKEYGK